MQSFQSETWVSFVLEYRSTFGYASPFSDCDYVMIITEYMPFLTQRLIVKKYSHSAMQKPISKINIALVLTFINFTSASGIMTAVYALPRTSFSNIPNYTIVSPEMRVNPDLGNLTLAHPKIVAIASPPQLLEPGFGKAFKVECPQGMFATGADIRRLVVRF